MGDRENKQNAGVNSGNLGALAHRNFIGLEHIRTEEGPRMVPLTDGFGGFTLVPYAALTYRGVWNASTNTPTLVSGVGLNGDYYVVTVAGTTLLDGTNDWEVGDWVVFNGTTWQKVDNSDQFFLPRELVYAPGAVSPPKGVYTTWSSLMSAVASYAQPITVVFDNTSGAIAVPAGTHTFPVGTILRGRNTVAQTDVTFADGAILVGVREFRMGLRCVSASTSAVMTFSSGSQQIVADNCNFRAGSTGAFFRVTTAATVLQMRLTGVVFESSTSPVVQIATSGASGTLNLYAGCNVGTNTLAKVTGATLVLNRDANTVYSATQTGIVGATFTNNLIDLESQISGLQWRPPVASFASLPGAGNTTNDLRYAVAQNVIYRWTGAAWVQVNPLIIPPDYDTITHFVWKPGSSDDPAYPNRREKWEGLVELMLTYEGLKIVQIDDSAIGGPVTMPGGEYNLPNTIFYAKPSLQRIEVRMEKVVFRRGFASEGPIDWVSVAGDDPVVTPDDAADIGNTETRFAEGSTYKRDGGQRLMAVHSGESARLLLGRNCKIYQGSDFAIEVEDGADFEMQLSDNAIVEPETVRTGGGPNSFTVRVLSPAAQFQLPQSSIAAPQPWTVYANSGRLQTIPLTSFSTPVTLTAADFGTQHILGDAGGGDVVITLPFANEVTGRSQFAKKIDGSGNVVQFLPQGGETIDGGGDLKLLSQYDGAWVYSDGVNWHVTART